MSRILAALGSLVPFRIVRVRNGRQAELRGHECVMLDNFVQTYIVRIRSQSSVGPQRLKDVIQTKFEVLGEPELVQTTAVAL